MVYQTNPGLDSRAIPRPDNAWVKRARTGGVTTTMMIPGSGTNMGGFGTVVSTGGKTPDEIVVRSPGSLKIAQAGNPEWYFGGNGRSFMNWNTRQTIEKARAYWEKWQAYEKLVQSRPTAVVPGPQARVRPHLGWLPRRVQRHRPTHGPHADLPGHADDRRYVLQGLSPVDHHRP
jgi:hypothetical protein